MPVDLGKFFKDLAQLEQWNKISNAVLLRRKENHTKRCREKRYKT